MNLKKTAFVLGLDPNGLGAVRSLGRNGIPVIGLDYKAGGPGFYSKYAETVLCPNPYLNSEEMCKLLMNLGNRLGQKGVLFPTSDEFVLFISRYRNKLKEQFLFALPPEDVIEALLNKRWQYLKAEETGTPYPQTFYPETVNDIDKVKDKIQYPAIVKPCYTHLWKEKAFGAKGFRINNKHELEEKLTWIFSHNVEVIIQSMIPGPATNFYEVCSYLNKESIPLCVFIKRKLRQYPQDMGLGSLMESVRDDKLANLGLNLLKGIKYHGIGEIEFKKDPRDGQFKMIEINSRVILQNSLADYCGINLPLIQYKDLIGMPLKFRNSYPEHKKWLWAEIDYEAFKQLKKNNEISWLSWLKSLAKCRSFAVFALNDMKPFLTYMYNVIVRHRFSRKKILLSKAKVKIMFMIDMIAGLHGTEKYLLNFVKLLDKEKFSPIIVSLYQKGKIAEEFYTLGIPIISMPIKRIYSPLSLIQFSRLYRIMRQHRVDILETIHKTSDLIGPAIGRIAGVKVIISNRRDMGFWRTTKDDIAYRFTDCFVDRIKCNTKAATKHFSQIEKVPISKFDVSYNGVIADNHKMSIEDIKKIKSHYGIKEGEIIIGVLGGVKKVKGHVEFLEMARILSRTHKNIKFLIVGGGYKTQNDEYFNFIKKLSFQKGLDGKVIFAGFIKDVNKILPIFDIAILPSYTEGCSNVLLEYMAAGKPVVATDVGGNPEIVLDGITGFIVPPKDGNLLKDKVERLLFSKSLRESMGRAAYRQVSKHFSILNIICGQMDYYTNLIKYNFLTNNS
jgi:D-aspartate ligase